MEQSNVVVDRGLLPKSLFRSIRVRLIVYFSLLFAIALILIELINLWGVPFTTYTGRQGQQREEAIRSLNLIADLKKDRLLRWVDERRGDAHVISTNNFIKSSVVELITMVNEFSEGDTLEAGQLRLQKENNYHDLLDFLNTVKSAYGVYDSLDVADASTGTVWVSTNETHLGLNISQQPFFRGVLVDGHVYLSDIELSTRTQRPEFHVSHIITNEANEVTAVLVMEVSADDILKPILHTGEGLGDKGEALLVNRDVRILTSLKHPLADGTIAQPLEYQILAQPAVRAARGEEGIIESEDYRGEPVLAAYRHLEVSSEGGWGMVVKRDQAELLAPLRQDILFSSLVGLVGIIAVAIVTIAIAASLTGPIRSLSWAANKVAAGQLEIRAPVTTADEVGLLAVTFNAMIERIQYWQRDLEAQVTTRTAELDKTNEELRLEVAERKRTEQALRILSSRNEAILAAVPDIIMEVDANKVYSWANRAGLDFFGDDVLGREAAYYFEGEQDTYEIVQPLFNGQKNVIYVESWQRRQDGAKRLLAWWCRTLLDIDGNVIGSLSTARDITQSKQVEQERERLNRELLEKNKELEQIVYVTSHDLRSPLVNIQGFSKELQHAFKDIRSILNTLDMSAAAKTELAPILEEDIPEALQYIFTSTSKMDSLLAGLLRLSRLGRVALHIIPLDMNRMISDIAEIFEFRLKAADVKLQIGHLPRCLGDEAQINQVFSNLLDNALKYLDADCPGIISISGRTEGEHAIYCVEDNGIGIAAEHQAKIYNIFHRLNPERGNGEGLGLTIVHKILDRHHGKIWVESAPGQGSKFFVSLPSS